jgi:hypothetical protein
MIIAGANNIFLLHLYTLKTQCKWAFYLCNTTLIVIFSVLSYDNLLYTFMWDLLKDIQIG